MHVAIACGGTGGHLFPGLAVARALARRGVRATLLVSQKEIDRQAVAGVTDVGVEALPAVGLQGRNYPGFAWAFLRSVRAARSLFRRDRPELVLAMGGFTSAPPVVAAKLGGISTALHESNTIPGRANRWLARLVDAAFVGFEEAVPRLRGVTAEVTGTPVRDAFVRGDAGAARLDLGLDPGRPVVAVLGGSQGATGLNDAVREALPAIGRTRPDVQFVHLTGARDLGLVEAAYRSAHLNARVLAFSDRVDVVLRAATVAIARSGASTLAEFAAMGLPSILVPFPAAVDDHQRFNAEAFARAGAARWIAQRDAQPRAICDLLGDLLDGGAAHAALSAGAARLHRADAADRIAERLLVLVAGPFASKPGRSGGVTSGAAGPGGGVRLASVRMSMDGK